MMEFIAYWLSILKANANRKNMLNVTKRRNYGLEYVMCVTA